MERPIMKKLLVFTVAEDLFAVDMASVSRISGEAVEVPAPDGRKGKRGSLPEQQLDLWRLFECPSSRAPKNRQRMLNVTIGRKRHSLIVDHIDGVFECSEDRLWAMPPVFAGPARDCFPQVVVRQGRIIPVLDLAYAVWRFAGESAETNGAEYLPRERPGTHG
jgi:chemotaxis signal transduction protein